ncbi:ankyrin repeat-containing domain protein [Tricharina praecox]|uniref:ankyrin repeat-containing domain protein n=1 Tax=Tricharina praecox TaxID=43433 RepID=UPI0022205086|nr:ankyrin repeat-containing domain protein [Tricharina praecox]KAI5858988.1 ankyrin repeat-containing domain protein [Tricharina praecox]
MVATLLSLPREVHLLIADKLTTFRDKSSLARTSRGLYHINRYLYRYAIRSGFELNGPPLDTIKLLGRYCILTHLVSRDRRGLPGLSRFLEHGLDIEIKLSSEPIPLLAFAMETHRYEWVRFLLERGANPSVSGGVKRGGLSVLGMAVRDEKCGLARLLLAEGADVNMADAAGKKPLYDAVANGNVDLVRLLVDHGADMDASVGLGVMDIPLRLARWFDQGRVMRCLIDNGADTSCLKAEEMAYVKKYIH